jgi:hypothetical protein
MGFSVAEDIRFELMVGCYTYDELATRWFNPSHPILHLAQITLRIFYILNQFDFLVLNAPAYSESISPNNDITDGVNCLFR